MACMDDYVRVVGDREQVMVPWAGGNGYDAMLTLRGLVREGLIPRTLEDARMDRYRYRCPGKGACPAWNEDDGWCENPGCFPSPHLREGGRDYYDYEQVNGWYEDQSQLRSRANGKHRMVFRAVS